MNARGERILIFGDSLTQHVSNGPVVWDVDQGPARASHAPGDLLASLLLDQGARAVRTNARVGRSAVNFWAREPAQSLIANDLAWRPTKIVFVLGTNDVGLAQVPDEQAFRQLVAAYKPSGAEIWAIGPFTSRLPAASVAKVAETMRRVFGSRFLDGRPLSTMVPPGSDGVHYAPTQARALALNLADALLSTFPGRAWWWGTALGAAIVVGGALAWGLWNRRKQVLSGLEIVDGRRHTGSVNELIRAGYRQVPCKSGLDAKGLARCWSRGVLGAPETDDDEPRPGEDDEHWWERLRRQSEAKEARVRKALAQHDALILTTRGGRRVLVIKTPEMADTDEGDLRVTTFDEDGPIGHTTRRGVAKLAQEIYRDWHPEQIEPASEADVLAWTNTERFAKGAAAVAEVQRLNRGELGLTLEERTTLARVVADFKEVARRRGYADQAGAFGACDTATADFIKAARQAGIALERYRFNLTKARDRQRLAKLYKLDARTVRALEREAANAKDQDCMFHEIAITDDGYAIDWTANQFKALPTPFVFVLDGKRASKPKTDAVPAAPPAPAPVTRLPPEHRAQIVTRAAQAVPASGRYGSDKAFISEVHAEVVRQGVNISLDDFKRELVRMLPRGEVRLVRADLVGAMDRRLVQASEVSDMGADFHFVLVPEGLHGASGAVDMRALAQGWLAELKA